MFKKLVAFLFGRSSVDAILSNVNRNIQQLEGFASAERELAQEEDRKADALIASVRSRNAQAQRAESVASKLSALIK